jgi:hypothetical protein
MFLRLTSEIKKKRSCAVVLWTWFCHSQFYILRGKYTRAMTLVRRLQLTQICATLAVHRCAFVSCPSASSGSETDSRCNSKRFDFRSLSVAMPYGITTTAHQSRIWMVDTSDSSDLYKNAHQLLTISYAIFTLSLLISSYFSSPKAIYCLNSMACGSGGLNKKAFYDFILEHSRTLDFQSSPLTPSTS